MMKRILVPSLLAGLLAVPALADGSTTGGTTTNPITLNFTYACRGGEGGSSHSTGGGNSGGGSRVIAGTWDTSSGALNVTVTMTDCMGPGGDSVNGTDTIAGTFLPDATGQTFTIKTTETIDTQLASANGKESLARKCTITRDGSFTRDTFTGTTTRDNCTLSGSYREDGSDAREVHLLENLLKRASSTEDD